MTPAICIAVLAISLLSFAVGYCAGWLDGNQRSVLLDELPEWAKRPTTEGDTDAR